MTTSRTPRALAAAALASALVFALSACSGRGHGHINSGGRIISDTARDVKEEL